MKLPLKKLKKNYKKLVLGVLLVIAVAFAGFKIYPLFTKDKDQTVVVNGWSVTFTKTKCTNETVKGFFDRLGLKDEYKPLLKQGQTKKDDLSIEMCYVIDKDNPNVALVVTERGEIGEVDLEKQAEVKKN